MFKLPWLRSRKILLISVIIECIIFFLVFLFFSLNLYPNYKINLEVFLFLPTWLVICYVIGLYNNYFDRLFRYSFNFLDLLKNLYKTFLSCLIQIGLYFFFMVFTANYFESIKFYHFVDFSITLAITSFIFRFIYKKYLKVFLHKKNWIVFSDKKLFESIKNELKMHNINSHQLFFYDKKENKNMDFNIVSGLIISGNQFDDQFLRKFKNILSLLKGVSIFTINEWCGLVLNRYPVKILPKESEYKLFLSSLRTNYSFRIKRIGDLIFGSLLLIFTLPISIIVALLIKLNDGGSIFIFKEERTF